jgi:excinuclease ABC subunit A
MANNNSDITGFDHIEILGAREHNLKNIDLTIPRNKLVVFTGISGSGKSSLAFDTVYAEGQRRYMESFSAYARSFMGNMERPDVDKINGLSPVISIEQKTTSKNPRSTVGTVTEIYDFMRLLYARAGEAFSYVTGEKMVKQSIDQIIDVILQDYQDQKLILLAPVVKGRKGHYRELFVQIEKLGYTKVRVDGVVMDIQPKMQLDRFKIHDIEIVIDRIVVKTEERFRLSQSVQTALNQGKGIMMVEAPSAPRGGTSSTKSDSKVPPLGAEGASVRNFSKYLMDPVSGISYDEPSPNNFSFNSPYGWCPTCQGLGKVEEITEDSILPDKTLSIEKGAIAPIGEYRDMWIFKQLTVLLKPYKVNLKTPIEKFPPEAIELMLYGTDAPVAVPSTKHEGTDWNTTYEGIVNFLKRQQETGSEKIQDWIKDFMVVSTCPDCKGLRLKKESLHFLIDQKNIAQLAEMDITELAEWFTDLEPRMNERQNVIAKEILKEIRKRIGFLTGIGLEYLTLNRPLGNADWHTTDQRPLYHGRTQHWFAPTGQCEIDSSLERFARFG